MLEPVKLLAPAVACLVPLLVAASSGGCSSSSTSSAPSDDAAASGDVGATADGASEGDSGLRPSSDGSAAASDSGQGSGSDSAATDSATSTDDGATNNPGDSGPSSGGDGGGPPGTMQMVEMTFYGWEDNSPPGNAIAYPQNGGFPTVHNAAGGTGTYADPITFATDMSELPPGTLVYAPVIEKYVVMEDDCTQCDSDWSGSKMWHIDVWMNSDGSENANSLNACEGKWTQSSTTIEINPPQGRTVTTAPLFVPATNTCRSTP